MKNQTKGKGKATVVITYNSVKGYPAGTYSGKKGPVVVYSHDNTSSWEDEAESMLGQIMHGLYGRVNPEDVEKVYIYVGLNAKDGALRAAESLAGRINKLEIVACDCHSDEKKRTAERIGAPIIWADCGGRQTLGSIVTGLLK